LVNWFISGAKIIFLKALHKWIKILKRWINIHLWVANDGNTGFTTNKIWALQQMEIDNEELVL
jgi:hypothetical protein